MKLSVLTLTAAIAFAGAAQSATIINYNEGIDGDAGSTGTSAVALGTLAASGDVITVKGGTGTPSTDKRDIYRFSALSSFALSIDVFNVTPDEQSSWRLFRDDGDFSVAEDGLLKLRLGSGTYANAFGTRGAGDYLFWINENAAGVTTNYSVSIAFEDAIGSRAAQSVSPVPLPAGLPLLIGGIGAFAWMRRRQRA